MKRLQTVLCSIAFAILGVCIASVGNKDRPYGANTVHAAILPHIPKNAVLPIDLQLGHSLENKKDTVIIRDTVRVTNTPKKVKVPYRITKRDTIYQTVVFVAIPEVRLEGTSAIIDSIDKVHIVDTIAKNDSLSAVEGE